MSDPLGPTYGVVLACVLLGAVLVQNSILIHHPKTLTTLIHFDRGYGITIMQTYWYSTHFPADKLKVKITVIFQTLLLECDRIS